jgi:hypothetical protein
MVTANKTLRAFDIIANVAFPISGVLSRAFNSHHAKRLVKTAPGFGKVTDEGKAFFTARTGSKSYEAMMLDVQTSGYIFKDGWPYKNGVEMKLGSGGLSQAVFAWQLVERSQAAQKAAQMAAAKAEKAKNAPVKRVRAAKPVAVIEVTA